MADPPIEVDAVPVHAQRAHSEPTLLVHESESESEDEPVPVQAPASKHGAAKAAPRQVPQPQGCFTPMPLPASEPSRHAVKNSSQCVHPPALTGTSSSQKGQAVLPSPLPGPEAVAMAAVGSQPRISKVRSLIPEHKEIITARISRVCFEKLPATGRISGQLTINGMFSQRTAT